SRLVHRVLDMPDNSVVFIWHVRMRITIGKAFKPPEIPWSSPYVRECDEDVKMPVLIREVQPQYTRSHGGSHHRHCQTRSHCQYGRRDRGDTDSTFVGL